MKLKSLQAGPMPGIVFAAIFSHAVFAAGTHQFPVTNAAGDGVTVNTKMIQAAIDQCAAAGGGTVVIPKGVFVLGCALLQAGRQSSVGRRRGVEGFDKHRRFSRAAAGAL